MQRSQGSKEIKIEIKKELRLPGLAPGSVIVSLSPFLVHCQLRVSNRWNLPPPWEGGELTSIPQTPAPLPALGCYLTQGYEVWRLLFVGR